MIRGSVQSEEARIHLKVRGPRGREREISAIIDTGFTASLTLPPAVISTLKLRWHSSERGTLARMPVRPVRGDRALGSSHKTHPGRRIRGGSTGRNGVARWLRIELAGARGRKGDDPADGKMSDNVASRVGLGLVAKLSKLRSVGAD